LKEFDCDGEALGGIRLILRTRLGEMYDLREAALDWEDIEGVHGMRVASRRLRSALKDFGGFLGSKSVPQRRLKEVADALGEVRDQDVAIAALEKMRSKASEDVAAGIGRLVDERAAVRELARTKLTDIVAETPLAELQKKFLARLEKAGAATGGKQGVKQGGKRGRRATKAVSFRQAGREVIAARVAELQELSDSLHHPFDIEPLHTMRIAAKRLRYAMELFAPCWGGKLTACSREVAELQTSLGELRDCDIWIADLGARLDRNRAESVDAAPNSSDEQGQVRRAAVWLLNHFTKERGKHFRQALARWEKWETTAFFARMESVLNKAQNPTTDSDVPVDPEMTVTHAAAQPDDHDSES
jgi:CHAD domain-containing protein